MTTIPRTAPRMTATNPYIGIHDSVVSGETGNRVRGILEDGFQRGADVFRDAAKLTFNATKMILGLFAVVGGAVAAAVFKENTAADWGSKILMILGAVLGILGFKDLLDHNKGVKDVKPEFAFKTISNGEEIKLSANGLKILDPNFFKENDPSKPKSESKIGNNEKDDECRNKAAELLKKYTSSEIIQMISSYHSGIEDAFTNIEDRNIPESELQDRIALLLGYVYGSRPDAEADPAIQKLFDDVLEADKVSESYFKVLPQDFVKTYYSVKWFENNKGSVPPLIASPPNPLTLDHLNKIQLAQNQLNVLQNVIIYVLDPNNLNDVKSARNVHVLRQALICGFNLKGNNVTEFNTALKTKLQDIKKTLETLTKHINETILPKIPDEKFPFERRSGRSDSIQDDVLKNMSWYVFVEKPEKLVNV